MAVLSILWLFKKTFEMTTINCGGRGIVRRVEAGTVKFREL